MDIQAFIQYIGQYKEGLIYLTGFVWILFASDYFAKYLQRIKLPLITGFLVTGILCGPQVLGLIEAEALPKLNFINDLSLAFIAFAAGAELYLKEIRSRINSILWNTFGQLVVTFVLSSLAVYFLADFIPFMQDMDSKAKIAVAILIATIFVARSPSSAIAIINEMRAKGPFTQTAIGVTVVKDVLVIILFTICFSIATTLITGEQFNFGSVALLLVELTASFGFGYGLGKLIALMIRYVGNTLLKTSLLIFIGYAVFYLSNVVRHVSESYVGFELHFEPLLICIIGSFVVTNYSKYRQEFQNILHKNGPFIYVTFFTLTGMMMSLDVLAKVWSIALLLFFVRLISMIIGAYIGATLAKDDPLHKRIGWMPYVTQAGVGLGLAIEVSREFSSWGEQFSTIIIAVIVLNQFVGPPIFKWAITRVGESHLKAKATHDGVRDAIIFGLEASSLSLARQLEKHGWGVQIASLKTDLNDVTDIDLHLFEEINLASLEQMEAKKSEAIVLMLSDEENFRLCELIYEHVGTNNVIVRLHDRANFNKFHEFGALIVEPNTAMVSLMDHFVRSPAATSLLLGMEKDQETIDIEVQDPTLHGIAIRDLKLPSDIIILSVHRKDQMILSHGYTRLRVGDIVTLVGSEDSLENTRFKFEE